jgi:phosphoribosylformimino-5-aminoimidazole carboxamide ribotide isomerase
MIHLVDLDATLGRGSNADYIKKIVSEVSIPVQVAGGLRNEETISQTLNFASRVVIGTLAFENKKTLQNILDKYGNEKIVISADHINGIIVINGWQKNTDIDLIEGINGFVEMGFTNFLITDVSKDGTLQGPDLKFLRKACDIEKTKIISSGGISTINDVINVRDSKADGVILGKALYENKISLEETKKIA